MKAQINIQSHKIAAHDLTLTFRLICWGYQSESLSELVGIANIRQDEYKLEPACSLKSRLTQVYTHPVWFLYEYSPVLSSLVYLIIKSLITIKSSDFIVCWNVLKPLVKQWRHRINCCWSGSTLFGSTITLVNNVHKYIASKDLRIWHFRCILIAFKGLQCNIVHLKTSDKTGVWVTNEIWHRAPSDVASS